MIMSRVFKFSNKLLRDQLTSHHFNRGIGVKVKVQLKQHNLEVNTIGKKWKKVD